MRQANFKFGEGKLDYSTTTGTENSKIDTFNGESHQDKREQQRERVTKAREAQFSYGKDPVSYDSIAKKAFSQKDLSQTATANAERELNGKDLRKTHFSFGNDEKIKDGCEVLLPTSQATNLNNQCKVTNVQIEHSGPAQGPIGSDRFVSTYRAGSNQLFQPGKFGVKSQTFV